MTGWRKRLRVKCLGGETSRGGNGLGVKRLGTVWIQYFRLASTQIFDWFNFRLSHVRTMVQCGSTMNSLLCLSSSLGIDNN